MDKDDIFGPCTFFLLDKLNKLRFEDYIYDKLMYDVKQIIPISIPNDQINEKLIAFYYKLNDKIIKIKKDIKITEILIEKDMGDMESEVYLDKLYDLPIEYPSLKKKKKRSYRKMGLKDLNIEQNKLSEQINKAVLDCNIQEYVLLMTDLYYVNRCISKIIEKHSSKNKSQLGENQ
jgi:hypothetical protein